jgi:calmodulin
VDANELATMLRYMGHGVSLQEAQQLVEQVDDNASGVLEWPEFLQVMSLLYPDKERELQSKFYRPAFMNFPEFTRPEIQVFLESFRKYDKDGSGGIDVDELEEAFKDMGQGFNKQQVKGFLDQVDADKSGQIEWLEFLQIMRNFYAQRRADFEKEFYGAAKSYPEFSKADIDVFAAGFREFDLDGSGSIDVDELGPALKALGQGYNAAELQSVIDAVDADKSGAIEFNEFLQIMKSLYTGKGVPQKPAATSTAPAKTTFQPATPSKSTQAPKTTTAPPSPKTTNAPPTLGKSPSGLSSHRDSAKCPTCGKTVYPIESLKVDDQVWHKGCFRCSVDKCNASLNLKNFKKVNGLIYCQKHVPSNKPTAVSVKDSLVTQAQVSAPKVTKMSGIEKTRRMTFEQKQQQQNK